MVNLLSAKKAGATFFSSAAVTHTQRWMYIRAHWSNIKNTLPSTWAKLSDADVKGLMGRREEIVELVKRRYGLAKEEAENRVDAWASQVVAS